MSESVKTLIVSILIPCSFVVALLVLYFRDFGFVVRSLGFSFVILISAIVPVFSYFASKRIVTDLFQVIAKKIGNEGEYFTRSDVIQFYKVAVGIFAQFGTWIYIPALGMFLLGILVGRSARPID